MDLLKELFPDIHTDELKLAFDSANGDLELASTMILSNQHAQTEAVVSPLDEVKSMFPECPSDQIEKIFKQEKGMVPNVITHLLTLEYLKNNPEPGPITPPSSKSKDNSPWGKTHNDLELVQLLTHWDGSTALLSQWYQENQFNARRTVVNMILSQRKQNHVPLPVRTPKKKHQFSRVQVNKGFAHGQAKKSKPQTTKPLPSIPTQATQVSHPDYLRLILNDQSCHGINPKFIESLFKYFQQTDNSNKITTDLDSCLQILTYILQDPQGIVLTFGKVPESIDDGEGSWIKVSTKPYHNLIAPTQKKHAIDKVTNDVFQTNKIDFHGYSPQQTLSTLNQVMIHWWDEEMKQRELNKKNLNQQTVQCLDPMTVITGRGIHSINGRSPVRFQVKRYLQLNGYLFHEEPALFEVYGKRSTRI